MTNDATTPPCPRNCQAPDVVGMGSRSNIDYWRCAACGWQWAKYPTATNKEHDHENPKDIQL